MAAEGELRGGEKVSLFNPLAGVAERLIQENAILAA
ncbi:hypothetical protein AGR7C_Cc110335 [Agrobacterium deltaense Zutra 3/1]|uniref:Uncharacterized protein n=1 Tax=Agrobacterium deltaense Zutra 3/1 TaxID=1183427 RepID=A0A1S7P4J8_9HYPH|nr:hypothetical protein AGR7C_Cc110335 [Agrobacterium deltaense Zutra 3/1]